MKKLTLLFTLVSSLFILNVNAQIKVPKIPNVNDQSILNFSSDAISPEILKALKPDASLDLSDDQTLQLDKNNTSFVDNVFSVLNGSGTDEEKEQKIGILQTDRKNFIEKLLGEGKTLQYYQLVKQNVEPLIKKYALAKYFM